MKKCKAALIGIGGCGFCTLFYEDFNEAFVTAHPQFFPGTIGSKGIIINAVRGALRRDFGAEAAREVWRLADLQNHDCRFCEAC